ncbi:MAG: ribosomal RNA small subunit methyltransferase A [Erysipelotrichaceae bacterium]|nr:ribosomal RNA small subunit methyltransferase A [Erysipelotrichaceae bacterium]
MSIANINYVRKTLGELRATKRFGQNFLIDANIVDRIASNACSRDLKTIEIGPGLGALTEMLLKYSKDVDAYEIDKDMYGLLNEGIQDERLHVYLQDFLDADLSKYKEEVNICGNLPYYVTTPILFRVFESDLDFRKITVMVQKEVSDRLHASAGSEDYSALSIEVQYLFDVKVEMNVSKEVFYPKPQVDSAVISFTPVRERDREFEKSFFALVKNCFRMRRKTLYNNLKDLYDADLLQKMFTESGMDQNIRAQQLSLEEFLRIHRFLEREER